MKFDPAIHTKEYLKKNSQEAISLAYSSIEFSYSDLTKEIEILQIRNKDGLSIAHILASLNRLDLSMELTNSIEILKMQDKTGWSVAHSIVESCFDFDKVDKIFNKEILSCEYDGWLLAEYICDVYDESLNLDLPTMAIKMIQQGAAYKHSKVIEIEDGNILVAKFEEIMDETNPLVKFKQIQAFYSTCVHNKINLNSSSGLKALDYWTDITSYAEGMLTQHADQYPKFLETENTIDFGCEPANDLFAKIKNKKILNDLTVDTNSVMEDTVNHTIY